MTFYKLLQKHLTAIIFCTLMVMFVLGYTESLRWPFVGPKATHGILKGLFLLLSTIIIIFRKKLSPSLDPMLNLLMLTFVFSFVISAVFSQAPSVSLLNLWYPLISLTTLTAFSKIRLAQDHKKVFIIFAIILVFLTSLFAITSMLYRYSVDNIYYFIFLEHRANHLLSELRHFGKYVSLGPYIMLIPLSMSLVFFKDANIVLYAMSGIIYLAGLFLAIISNNRIDVLILFIQSMVYMVLLPKRLAVLLLIFVFPLVSVGLNITKSYYGFNLEERIFKPKKERDQETIGMRLTYWQTALNNFKNYPLFGVGPNAYNEISDFPFRRYYNKGTRGGFSLKEDDRIGIHNLFIERLSDTGLVGFFSFVLLLFYLFKTDILAILRARNTSQRKQYLLFALSSWGWIMYGITDNGYGAQGFVTFFMIRGMMLHI